MLLRLAARTLSRGRMNQHVGASLGQDALCHPAQEVVGEQPSLPLADHHQLGVRFACTREHHVGRVAEVDDGLRTRCSQVERGGQLVGREERALRPASLEPALCILRVTALARELFIRNIERVQDLHARTPGQRGGQADQRGCLPLQVHRHEHASVGNERRALDDQHRTATKPDQPLRRRAHDPLAQRVAAIAGKHDHGCIARQCDRALEHAALHRLHDDFQPRALPDVVRELLQQFLRLRQHASVGRGMQDVQGRAEIPRDEGRAPGGIHGGRRQRADTHDARTAAVGCRGEVQSIERHSSSPPSACSGARTPRMCAELTRPNECQVAVWPADIPSRLAPSGESTEMRPRAGSSSSG